MGSSRTVLMNDLKVGSSPNSKLDDKHYLHSVKLTAQQNYVCFFGKGQMHNLTFRTIKNYVLAFNLKKFRKFLK